MPVGELSNGAVQPSGDQLNVRVREVKRFTIYVESGVETTLDEQLRRDLPQARLLQDLILEKRRIKENASGSTNANQYPIVVFGNDAAIAVWVVFKARYQFGRLGYRNDDATSACRALRARPSASGHTFDQSQRGLFEGGGLPDLCVELYGQRCAQVSRADLDRNLAGADATAVWKDRTGNPADLGRRAVARGEADRHHHRPGIHSARCLTNGRDYAIASVAQLNGRQGDEEAVGPCIADR